MPDKSQILDSASAEFSLIIREAAEKFVKETYTKPDRGDLAVTENAMRVGICLYLDHQLQMLKKQESRYLPLENPK